MAIYQQQPSASNCTLTPAEIRTDNNGVVSVSRGILAKTMRFVMFGKRQFVTVNALTLAVLSVL